jgi:hypothetical protein
MDRAIVARAVQALAALSTTRRTKVQVTAQSVPIQSNELAPCGSSVCAGCYDVGDGRKMHPPKIGEDYRKWLERWKPKGTIH